MFARSDILFRAFINPSSTCFAAIEVQRWVANYLVRMSALCCFEYFQDDESDPTSDTVTKLSARALVSVSGTFSLSGS